MFTTIKNILKKNKMKSNQEKLLQEIAETEDKLKTMRKLAEDMNKKKSVLELSTWKEICEYSNRDPNKLPDVSAYDERHRKHAIADFKLTIINEVKNEGWAADYDNKSQFKWYNYFKKVSSGRSSGFVYSGSYYFYGLTCTYLGSRFAFETEAKANSACAGEEFLQLWNDLLL